MTNPASSPVVSIRSTLSDRISLPASVPHIDLLESKTGGYINLNLVPLTSREKYRDNLLYTVITRQQRLVFHFPNLLVNGWAVNASLSTVVAPDAYDPIAFLRSFYPATSEKQFVTVQTMGIILKPFLRRIVIENLSRLNLAAIPASSPIRSNDRHARIGELMKGYGLHLFVDELTLDPPAEFSR